MLFSKRRFSKVCDRFFRGRDSIVDKENRRSSPTHFTTVVIAGK
jgi:hypothetical protein